MGLVEPVRHQLRTGETAVIRSAQVEDAAVLLAHGSEVIAEFEFALTLPEEFNLTVEQEAAWISGYRDDSHKLCLVAEAAGALVGMLFFEPGERRRLAHRGVVHMSVDKAWRRKGIGTLLLQTCLDWARRHPGIDKVALAVFATNVGAISLYRKLGFIEEGRRIKEIKFGPGRYVDDILMYQWVQ